MLLFVSQLKLSSRRQALCLQIVRIKHFLKHAHHVFKQRGMTNASTCHYCFQILQFISSLPGMMRMTIGLGAKYFSCFVAQIFLVNVNVSTQQQHHLLKTIRPGIVIISVSTDLKMRTPRKYLNKNDFLSWPVSNKIKEELSPANK